MMVVGFSGSPRNGSNTDVLLDEMLKGARDAGAETKIFKLSNMDIGPCKACGYCKSSNGECATADDMQILYKEIKEADAFILGSPVYMWQMSAQAKLFTDRLYATFGTGFEEKYGKKNVALVFSQGNPDENSFSVYFDYVQNMFGFLGFKVVDLFSSQGNNVPGAVKEKEGDLTKAKAIGRKLVEG